MQQFGVPERGLKPRDYMLDSKGVHTSNVGNYSRKCGDQITNREAVSNVKLLRSKGILQRELQNPRITYGRDFSEQ